MRIRIFLAGLLLITLPAGAERLDPKSINYLGHFLPPVPQGSGTAQTWSWGLQGMTLIPDCLGRTDPSPSDGYPGCIGAFGNVNGYMFGVFDIVPPGRQARQVVPFYVLGEDLPREVLGFIGSEQYWDVLLDQGPGYCRLWWTYGTWYVRIREDPPFLGMSSCDPNAPNPKGMWDFGPEWSGNIEDDPYATAKMYRGLSIIPSSLADQHFDGKQMMLGISFKNGTVGASQGPSLYVRNLAIPKAGPPGPVMDLTPLLWYRFTNYAKWWDEPEMNGGAARHWLEATAYGAEFVASSAGDAVVIPWEEPTINPLDYPCSDPSAYRDNDPTTPEPCEIPVCWYGVGTCTPGPALNQQPSFWEDTSTGQPMPKDCNIKDKCRPSTGPHCLSERPFLILYDLDELADVYAGRRPHNNPQPYAKIPLEDYFLEAQECGSESAGSTYDSSRQILFVSEGRHTPAIHMFAIGGGTLPPPPPPPPASELTLEPPTPALAGRLSDFKVTGAPPGARVVIVAGRKPGSVRLRDLCPNTVLGIRGGHGIGFGIADPQGVAEMAIRMPPGLAGQNAYLQALETASCEASNLVIQPIQ